MVPRSLILECNRNLAPPASVTAVYTPREMWELEDYTHDGHNNLWGLCYYGASITAMARLAGELCGGPRYRLLLHMEWGGRVFPEQWLSVVLLFDWLYGGYGCGGFH